MLRDDQVKSTLQQRQLALISREWEVEPGGKKRRDIQAAESIEAQLNNIRFDAITEKMLNGVFYGYAVAEALWVRDGREIVADAIKVRDRRRFGFRPSGELVLRTTRNPDGEPVPPRKFWHFANGATHDDEPYGLGLAHWLYWPVLFKRNGIKFWLIFLEKFGMPTGVGKFPTNTSKPDQDRLLAAVQAIQSDSGIIIPEGMQVELLEAARSGAVDYNALCARMDAAISKVVLGHSASADATPGRLGGEDNAMAVRQDLVKADADLICHSATMSWVRWLTDWNYPGAAYPRVWRRVENEPDLKAQSECDKNVFALGFRPTLDYITDTYGEGWEEKPAAPPPAIPLGTPNAPQPGQPPAPGTEPADPAFAAPAALPDYADQVVAQLGRNAEPFIRDMLDQILAILEGADSYPEAVARVEAAFGDLDSAGLAEQIRIALAAAEGAGRHDEGITTSEAV